MNTAASFERRGPSAWLACLQGPASHATALALSLLLAACGGGGSEPDSSRSTISSLESPASVSTGTQTGTQSGAKTVDGSQLSLAQVATPTSTPPAHLTASQLVLLVAEGDAFSEQVARAYQAARGINDQHVLHVRLPAGVGDVIGEADFTRLKTDIDAKLGSQAQALLVTWTQPSRVQGPCVMSITSAMTFGFDPRYCGGCSKTQPSPYYNHATAQPFTSLGLRPAMMLGASTLAQAEDLIARGLRSEALMTTETQAQGVLVRTTDSARSVRWPDFLRTVAMRLNGLQWNYRDETGGALAADSAGKTKLMFYLTGLAQVPDRDSHQWLPGAVADHLTSYGGLLPNAEGQMPATAWLSAGATGSYGTVEEPCNYVEKFPRASVLADRYSRGETLIEAYWKSVQWPGQGLFVGDPLARPWPRS